VSGASGFWLTGPFLALYGSEESVAATLECDLWWGRRLLLGLRTMFVPPPQLAG